MTVNVQGNAQIYNIFQYGGTLTQTPGTIFSVAPTINGAGGADYRLDIVAPGQGPNRPGMIRLLSYDPNTGEIAQYWNGGAPPPYDGGLVGGSGTWVAALANWTDQNGANPTAWASSVGYFQGTQDGTVTVDGTQGFDKLYFSDRAYTLTGGTLQMSPRRNTFGEINVDTVTAIIASDIIDGMSVLPAPANVNTLTKSGSGTLVFTHNKGYGGATTVSTGTLQLGDGTAANNSTLNAGITIAAGATLAVNQGGALSFSNILTAAANPGNPAHFNVMGTGVLTFSSNSNTFLGLTTVSAGTLNLSGTLGGAVTVSGGTLQGTGTIGGDVMVQSGGTLVGDITTTPALMIGGDLTLAGTSMLNVTLNPMPNTGALIVTNTLTMQGGTVTFTPATLAQGRYNLISYTSRVGDASVLTLLNNPNGYQLLNDPGLGAGFLYIHVGPPTGQPLLWHPLAAGPNNFGGTGTWDASTTASWAETSAGAPLIDWIQSDIAVFTQQAGTVTVDSSAAITVNGMRFTVTDYELTGAAANSTLTLDDGPG
ncbi:autotransporter-associated beta strand repeat-containing protein, partial [Martelella radicis]